jgi:5-methylcytosine-specific restriction endonuclease McrA
MRLDARLKSLADRAEIRAARCVRGYRTGTSDWALISSLSWLRAGEELCCVESWYGKRSPKAALDWSSIVLDTILDHITADDAEALPPGRILSFDHIIPYSKGGSSKNPANIQILCGRHNLAKGDNVE